MVRSISRSARTSTPPSVTNVRDTLRRSISGTATVRLVRSGRSSAEASNAAVALRACAATGQRLSREAAREIAGKIAAIEVAIEVVVIVVAVGVVALAIGRRGLGYTGDDLLALREARDD